MVTAQRRAYDPEPRPGEITEAVGHAVVYDFSKQFKKSFGVSPSRYRKEVLNR
jgi:YesN/AraC family two-component response regulator